MANFRSLVVQASDFDKTAKSDASINGVVCSIYLLHFDLILVDFLGFVRFGYLFLSKLLVDLVRILSLKQV